MSYKGETVGPKLTQDWRSAHIDSLEELGVEVVKPKRSTLRYRKQGCVVITNTKLAGDWPGWKTNLRVSVDNIDALIEQLQKAKKLLTDGSS